MGVGEAPKLGLATNKEEIKQKFDDTVELLQNTVKNLDASKIPPLGHPVADMAKNMAVEKIKEFDLKQGIKDVQNFNKKIQKEGLLGGIGSLF